MDSVSDIHMIAYVLGTDIIAAFPLLLKGIVLMQIVENRPPLLGISAIGYRGGNLEILEYWDFLSRLTGVLQLNNGAVFILISLSFMMASSFTEFLCWRRVRYRKKLKNGSVYGKIRVPGGTAEGIISSWNRENCRWIVSPTFAQPNDFQKQKRILKFVFISILFAAVTDTHVYIYWWYRALWLYSIFLVLLHLILSFQLRRSGLARSFLE